MMDVEKLGWLTLAIMLCAGAGCAPAQRAHELTLADKGTASAVIVVGNGASATEEYAAQELRDYIRNISGAELPIRKEGEPDGGLARILIGTPGSNSEVAKLKDALQLERRQLGRDGLLIMTTGNTLALVGSQAPGALYATYAFLEEHLGVRWFFPGEKGEYVPKMKTIKIASIENAQKPSLQYRGINPVGVLNDDDTDTWLGRNRMNFRRAGDSRQWLDKMVRKGLMSSMLGEETLGKFLPARPTFAAHPEWLSLVKGKREQRSHPCLSNPDVVVAIKQGILNYLQKNPDTEVLMIGQYDYDMWCQCEKCLAMDAPEDRTVNAQAEWNARASTRWHKFLNEILPDIQKSYPKMTFATYAYLQTMRPPSGGEPFKDMIILYCMNARCARHTYEDTACPLMQTALNGSAAGDRGFGGGLLKWDKFDNPKILYSYIGNFGRGLPSPIAYLVADEIKYVKGHKYVGWLTERNPPVATSDSWYGRKLDCYIAAKLCWNTDADLETMRADFFQKFYGKAGDAMKSQYDLLEKTWMSKAQDVSIFASGYAFLDDAVTQQARNYLAKAKELAAQDVTLIQERVARDQMLFEKLAAWKPPAPRNRPAAQPGQPAQPPAQPATPPKPPAPPATPPPDTDRPPVG